MANKKGTPDNLKPTDAEQLAQRKARDLDKMAKEARKHDLPNIASDFEKEAKRLREKKKE